MHYKLPREVSYEQQLPKANFDNKCHKTKKFSYITLNKNSSN